MNADPNKSNMISAVSFRAMVTHAPEGSPRYYRPQPYDAVRHPDFRCDGCGFYKPDAPMLHNAVWLSIAKASESLCIPCVVQRLNRHITLDDLRPCPMNGAAAYFGSQTRETTPPGAMFYFTAELAPEPDPVQDFAFFDVGTTGRREK